MLMMMMMMKKKGSKSVAVVALLLASVNCLLPPSKEDLNQISLQGEKYLDKQIETAVNGVKEMKSVMQTSSEDHQRVLDVLEKTKEQKEEAVLMAQEMEAKLEQEQEVCNETTRALWEQCKPCLKNTCVKYYSRTCSSGSGLVGRQLEELLNRTSPFSIWINGENTGVLEQEGQRQRKVFNSLQEQFTEMTDVVDNLFSESLKVANHVHFSTPVFFFPNFLGPSRSIRSLFNDPLHGFQDMFSPMMDMGRNLFSSMGSMADVHSDTAPSEDGSVNEDVVITKPFGSGRMTCREIRRNSAGCLKFREECQKCKEIQHIDCAGVRPLEGPLKEELEEALASAERFTQQYSRLLKTFKEQMFNTSSTLDQLNREFGWVSSLANSTGTKDHVFRVHEVNITNTEGTNVSVQLFDFPPMSFSVDSDILWTDPKFSEVVAQEALDRYKEASIVVK
ncbi:clusterin [Pseudoliparis swirei]|uniref:clusterin n=1 Tax=Pseudoliparis swirei TaxID=2059687 RepID=UPI0024BE2B94|nr:clusterin [Pseudoliparis swirei]